MIPKKRTHTSTEQASKNMITGRRSKHVQAFLEEHNLQNVELPSSGSLLIDMKLKIALWKEKKEAMEIAISIIKTADDRSLSWFNQLISLNLHLVDLERELIEKGENPLKSDEYVRAQKLIADIRQNFDKMQADVLKTRAEHKIRRGEETDVMFENVYADKP